MTYSFRHDFQNKSKYYFNNKNRTVLKNTDIEKYNEQYHNLKIIFNDDYHDRFIILDNKQVYHLGASLNHAGKRIFAINKLEDKEIIKVLLEKIQSIKKLK